MALPMGLFKETVMSSFAFLTETYGFEYTHANETAAQYESSFLSIAIRYDPYSSEIDLSFSRPEVECPYSLAELMALNEIEFEWGGTYAQASTPQALRKVVHAFALVLRQYGAGLLAGDLKVFDQLTEKQRQCTARTELDEIRKRADEAWQKKDYAELAHLLEPIQAWLSPHESRRLEYARKRSGCAGSKS